MVTIRVTRKAGTVRTLTVSGHAGQGDPGEDVVCAGISALVETLGLALERVVPGGAEWTVKPGDARFRLQGQDGRQEAVAETIVTGLRDLADSYPKFARFLESDG
jgi:uncharacterized protein YsxB (DUF464 family)